MSTPRRMEAMYMAVMQAPPPFCFIENGFDYFDNDIGNAPADDASKCCDKCSAFGTGCTAWSWSNFNGGTCWFKSARGAIVVNPNVKSSLLFASPPAVCQLQANTDYKDNDLARMDSPTPGGCCDICRNFLGCRAFSHSNFNGGSCWLKSAKGEVISNPGVTSAEVYPSPPKDPSCPNALEENTDFVDNDIGNVKSSTPSGCCSLCKNWMGGGVCRSFSWSNHEGGTCWLKSAKGSTISKAGVTSSMILPNPPVVSCVFEEGIDFVDNDFANVPGTADSCCAACKARAPVCKAFSWSNFQGGTCWLKTAKGATVANPGVRSAVI
ncbi:hypothetical protein FI667_g3100, partial [Globisporangium splendens]